MHRHRWTLRLARGLVISSWLGSVGTAHALGLGKLTVHSGLDEALNADIELTAAPADDLKKVTAGLASRDEFDSAGIDRSTQLNDIKYTVSRRADGRPILKLSSDQPMREPFLHFLLQVNWQGGRLLREYTALLDPPQLIAARESAVTPPVSEPAHTNSPANSSSPANSPAPAAPPVVSDKASAPTSGSTGSFNDVIPDGAPSAPTDVASNPKSADASQPEIMTPATADEVPTDASVTKTPTNQSAADGLLGPGASVIPEAASTNAAPPAATASETNNADGKSSAPAPGATSWVSTEYGPIKRGETLSQITKQLNLTDGVTSEQVMLALLKANKSAFFGNNVNNLKVGKVLAIPERSQIEATPRTTALKQFRAQYSAWQEYKLKLASTAQMVKVPAGHNIVTGDLKNDTGSTTKTPEIKADVKPTDVKTSQNTTGKDGANDLLKIVRAGPDGSKNSKSAGGDAKAERQRLADRATTLEEAITSKEMENKELRERVSQLEAQVKNTKRLIALEDKDLAKAQQQVGKAAGGKDKDNIAAATAATATTAPVVKPQTGAASPTAPQTAPISSAAKAPVVSAKPPVKVAPVPAQEPSFIDGMLKNITDNALVLPILLGVLVIAGLMALVYMRKRRRAIAEFGESILAGGGINANSEGNVTAEGNAGDVSFLSDFSQGGMGNIHTDEVDPIAEAEVYLAYGRDEQAEEILKEAVVKDPNRHELRLKLLEIYHQRNDLPAFETVAEELYASLEGKGGKVWEKAEEMGRKLNPDNPLFRGAGKGEAMAFAGAAAGAAVVAAATMRDATFVPSSASAQETGAASTANDNGFDLDFSTDTLDSLPKTRTPTMNVPPELAAPESSGIDFDFNSLVIDPVAPESNSTPQGMALSDLPDFDVGFESASAKAGNDDAGMSMFEATPPQVDHGGSDVDANDFDSQIDETATKLDLAKAYIDMGDADGARSILDEVLAEGNDVQKKQAAELARQIAA